jgi:hypothetical protein
VILSATFIIAEKHERTGPTGHRCFVTLAPLCEAMAPTFSLPVERSEDDRLKLAMPFRVELQPIED